MPRPAPVESSCAARPRRARLVRIAAAAAMGGLLVGSEGCGVIEFFIELLSALRYGQVSSEQRPAPPAPVDISLSTEDLAFDTFPWFHDSYARSAALLGGLALAGDPTAEYNPFFEEGEELASVLTVSGVVAVFDLSALPGPTSTFLTPPAPLVEGLEFGAALAAGGDRVFVGAPQSGDSGAVHVVRRVADAWVREGAPIAFSGGFGGEEFGAALAADGDLLVVGAPSAATDGRAYVFEYADSTWVQRAVLGGDGEGFGERFGRSVAISGTRVVVGAPGYEGSSFHTGAAFVFDRSGSGWVRTKRLTAPDAELGQRFGWDVAADAGRIVVSAPGASQGGNPGAGAVYGFDDVDRPGVFVARVGGTPPAGGLGAAIALRGDTLVVSGAAGSRTCHQFRLAGAVGSLSSTRVRDLQTRGVGVTDIALDATHALVATTSGAELFDVAAPAGPAKRRTTPPPLDDYVAFRADADAPEAAAVAFDSPREVEAPFRVELTAGAFDAARLPQPGARITFETTPAAGGEAVGLTMTYTGSGWTVAAHDGASDAAEGPLDIDAPILDLALEHDGDDLTLHARPEGSAFQRVATIASAPGGAHRVRIAADGLSAGAELGFDGYRTVATSAPATAPSPEDRIRALLYAAGELQLLAAGDLGYETPQIDAARARLEASHAQLEEALGVVEELRAGAAKRGAKTGPTAARAQVRKARSRVAKALKKLAKKPSSARKQAYKAVAFGARAIAVLE